MASSLKLQSSASIEQVAEAAFAISDPHSQAITISLLAPSIDILRPETQAEFNDKALKLFASDRLALDTDFGRERALAAARVIAKVDKYLQPEQRDKLAGLKRDKPELSQMIEDALDEKGFQSEVDQAIEHLGTQALDTDLGRKAAKVVAVADNCLQPNQRTKLAEILDAKPAINAMIEFQKPQFGPGQAYESQKNSEFSDAIWARNNVIKRGIIGDNIRLKVESDNSMARQMLKDRVRPRNPHGL